MTAPLRKPHFAEEMINPCFRRARISREEAWQGELPPERLLSAYEQAMGPQARNRGAIFMVAVRRKE